MHNLYIFLVTEIYQYMLVDTFQPTGICVEKQPNHGKLLQKFILDLLGFGRDFLCVIYYELAKRTKFLLAVIYRSPRRHSNMSKTNKNTGKDVNTFS